MKGTGGKLTSKQNLIKFAVGAAISAWAYNKLAATAADATQKGGVVAKIAGALGFKGPGIG